MIDPRVRGFEMFRTRDYWEVWSVPRGATRAENPPVKVRTERLGEVELIPEGYNLEKGYDDVFGWKGTNGRTSGVMTVAAVAYYLPNVANRAEVLGHFPGWKERGNAAEAGSLPAFYNSARGAEAAFEAIFRRNQVAAWTTHVAQASWGWTKPGDFPADNAPAETVKEKQDLSKPTVVRRGESSDVLGGRRGFIPIREELRLVVDPASANPAMRRVTANYPGWLPMPYVSRR
jgi:hypothetical protein